MATTTPAPEPTVCWATAKTCGSTGPAENICIEFRMKSSIISGQIEFDRVTLVIILNEHKQEQTVSCCIFITVKEREPSMKCYYHKN